MDFAPGDLYFTVVEFFSIIVPGAMLLALVWRSDTLARLSPLMQYEFAKAASFRLARC